MPMYILTKETELIKLGRRGSCCDVGRRIPNGMGAISLGFENVRNYVGDNYR